MEKVKRYLLQHFEQTFVLIILLVTAAINYFIPQKIAFLNFYFLPIILAGYYLGRRSAVLGSVMCVIFIGLYVWLNPELFKTTSTLLDVGVHVMLWGCFLILSGAVVGKLQENFTAEVELTKKLNEELKENQVELENANSQLRDYSTDLEKAVQERTAELQKSKKVTEDLKMKVEEALYTTMDSSVVKLMIEGRLRNEKRTVSVLFTDLVSFTTYSEELPPEMVIRDLNRYLSAVEPILLAYRGHIDKYLGDGVLCEFGAPLDYETHRLLAVLAAIKLQERITGGDFPWQMRAGIASGSTITGLIGSKRQTYTAIGDTVNLASRLESACPAGRILVDRFTNDGITRFIKTRKFRSIHTRDSEDTATDTRLEVLLDRLSSAPEDTGILAEIAETHLAIGEVNEALGYLEKALDLDPGNKDLKVLYADAGLRAKEGAGIRVKGKRKPVDVYEVIGLRDPLDDTHKLPGAFADGYRHVLEQVTFPEDVMLPVEALDGSIGHSKVVAVLAYALASRFKLNDVELQDVLHAAYTADIGKQAVPHHLLNRAGGLSASELEMANTHPIEGAKLLRGMGYDNDNIIEMVRHSHEKFDGSGQPDGLSGDAIPLGSRIIAVADAYDALTSWRPYREAWDSRVAIDEIRRNTAKGLYDPEVVDRLEELLA